MNQNFIDPTLPQNVPHLLEYLSGAIDREVSALIEPPSLAKSGAENRNYYISAKVETCRCGPLPTNLLGTKRNRSAFEMTRCGTILFHGYANISLSPGR